jgi:hypothetical protein
VRRQFQNEGRRFERPFLGEEAVYEGAEPRPHAPQADDEQAAQGGEDEHEPGVRRVEAPVRQRIPEQHVVGHGHGRMRSGARLGTFVGHAF